MRVIWVLENIQEDEEFYSRFNILLLLASVSLWRKNHLDDTLCLYADELTQELLTKLNVNYLWDEIITYSHTRNIDRSVFWACNKVAVLNQQAEPCVILDNDSLVFKPIKHLLDKVTVSNLEYGKGYYPGNLDPYIKKLSIKKRWKTDSLNVSFLYFPDVEFLKRYTDKALKLMEEFTEMKAPNSQYLIFAEQLILRDMLDTENIPYQSLVSTQWDCGKWDWGKEHNKGIWPYPESELYFKHYGPLKSFVKENKTELGYEKECKLLYNCINIRNLDLSSIKNK